MILIDDLGTMPSKPDFIHALKFRFEGVFIECIRPCKIPGGYHGQYVIK